ARAGVEREPAEAGDPDVAAAGRQRRRAAVAAHPHGAAVVAALDREVVGHRHAIRDAAAAHQRGGAARAHAEDAVLHPAAAPRVLAGRLALASVRGDRVAPAAADDHDAAVGEVERGASEGAAYGVGDDAL